MPSQEAARARELRKEMSVTERRVWSRLRRKQVTGHKFRRQLSIGPYFVDFVCLSALLVVEIDGPFHDEESDAKKTTYLESHGFRVARFPVADVDDSLDDVIAGIFQYLEPEDLDATPA